MRHEGGKNIAHANASNTTRSRITQLLALLAFAAACALSLPAIAGAAAFELNAAPAGVAPVSTSPPTLGPDGTSATVSANRPAWAGGRKVHVTPVPDANARLQARLNRQRAHNGEFCSTGCGSGTPPLVYHSGTVQHSPQVHLIFWGSAWNGSAGAAQIQTLFSGLAGSAYQGILTQYYGLEPYYVSQTVSVTSWTDNSVSAPANVNDAAIQNEIATAISNTGWQRVPDAQFVVLTPSGTTYASGFDTGFCGYHSYDSSDSVYAFVPYSYGPFASCADFDPNNNAANALSFVASHEYAESATDPLLTGWWAASGLRTGEIGDLCYLAGEITLPSGAHAQSLWDNHQGYCSEADTSTYAPDVVTSTASPVGTTNGTIKGLVTARGVATTYRFDWGETASYGNSTPETSVPSGYDYSPYEASYALCVPNPSTTYHYRVVATNANGTTYGGDQKFTTTGGSVEAAASGTSPVALYNSSSGWQHIYYTGANSQLWKWEWKGAERGCNEQLGTGEAAAGNSNPAAVLDSGLFNNSWVYYVGADGQIWVWKYGITWHTNTALGTGEAAAANTGPSVVSGGSSSTQYLYYTGADGQIWRWSWNGTSWTNTKIGGGGEQAASGTSPAASIESSGNQYVYYVGADGRIWAWIWNGSSWSNSAPGTGEGAATATSPAVVSNRTETAFYTGADGQIWSWTWNGSSWTNAKLGTGEAAGTSSTAAVARDTNNGKEYLYYRGADGQIWSWVGSGTSWNNSKPGTGEAAASGSRPAVIEQSIAGIGLATNVWVEYTGTSQADIWAWSGYNSSFTNFML